MMQEPLTETDFTLLVADKVAALDVSVASPEPLALTVQYGENEPVLTLRLEAAYAEYTAEPRQLDAILVPLVTEIGWTVHGQRYSFTDIAEHSLPILRDLLRTPFEADEADLESANSKGPLIYQELVNRPEERVIAQFVLGKNELVRSLHTGDMLRSYPEPGQFAAMAVQNLRREVLNIGLTLSEYQIEDFEANAFMVGFRGGRLRDFIASMIMVPEVINTLEQTLKAEDGLVAVIPARDKLIVSADLDEESVCQIGLLGRYLKDESDAPVSGFVWHFKDGILRRVQTIELADESVQNDDSASD